MYSIFHIAIKFFLPLLVLEYNKSNLYESAILENPIRVCLDVLRTIYETDYGFRVVISSFFADIFRGNALNNGILPLQVSQQTLDEIFKTIENNPNALLEIDVEKQTLQINDQSVTFDIDPYKKVCLINGYDDIDYLLSIKDDIESLEINRMFSL